MLRSFLYRHLIYVTYGVPVAAMVLIVICPLMGRRPLRFLRLFLAAILFVLACLAVCNYTKCGHWRYNSYLNAYEFYHYYMGSKYAHEIGYTNLYNASLVADELTGLKFSARDERIRDLKGGRYVRFKRVLKDKEKYKALFTEERWDEFVHDIHYLKKMLVKSRWTNMLRDKGYNATPVWSMIVGPLSNAVSTDSAWGMTLLSLLDVALLLGAFVCVWWVFGDRVALLMVVFMGTHFMMNFSTMKGSYLRTDWVVCLVVAVCMLKKQRYKTAGALTAYATLSRVFPAVFAFGIGAKFFLDFVRTRSVNRRYFAYLASFAVTIAVLVAASILYSGGPGLWQEFIAKIRYHNTCIGVWRVGFKYIFILAYKPPAGGHVVYQQFFEDWKLLWWIIQAFVLLVSVFLVQKLEDYEAMAYSFVPTFFLVSVTYYYYVMLLVPFLFFAPKLERPTRAIGLIMMFISSMVAYKCHPVWRFSFPLFFTFSCMTLALVLYMMALALLDAFKKETPEPAGASHPGVTDFPTTANSQ